MTQRAPTFTELAAAAWFKSSYSGPDGNECIEIAHLPIRILVRDSKTPAGPVLAFGRTAFAAFLDGVRDGEFDQPH
jgi:Domain of unknown function (DUF397)